MSERRDEKIILLEVSHNQEAKEEEPVSKKGKKKIPEQNISSRVTKDHSAVGE